MNKKLKAGILAFSLMVTVVTTVPVVNAQSNAKKVVTSVVGNLIKKKQDTYCPKAPWFLPARLKIIWYAATCARKVY